MNASPYLPPVVYTVELLKWLMKTALLLFASLSLIFLFERTRDVVAWGTPFVPLIFDGIFSCKILGFEIFHEYEIGAIPCVNISSLYLSIAISLIMLPEYTVL